MTHEQHIWESLEQRSWHLCGLAISALSNFGELRCVCGDYGYGTAMTVSSERTAADTGSKTGGTQNAE